MIIFQKHSLRGDILECDFLIPDLKPLKLAFFSIWVFFHEHSQFTRQQEKEQVLSLSHLYNFNPLHRHLDTSQAVVLYNSNDSILLIFRAEKDKVLFCCTLSKHLRFKSETYSTEYLLHLAM